MRSRYSAYVLGKIDYLRETWHPSTVPDDLLLDAVGERHWLGLSIRSHVRMDHDHATVEFIARSRLGGATAQRLHEISRFVREGDRWYYVDGTFPD